MYTAFKKYKDSLVEKFTKAVVEETLWEKLDKCLGSGLRKIYGASAQNGNPPLTYRDMDDIIGYAGFARSVIEKGGARYDFTLYDYDGEEEKEIPFPMRFEITVSEDGSRVDFYSGIAAEKTGSILSLRRQTQGAYKIEGFCEVLRGDVYDRIPFCDENIREMLMHVPTFINLHNEQAKQKSCSMPDLRLVTGGRSP